MYDRFKRNISYLRISVTDRCNLRCVYCMPAEGISLVSHDDILSFDEIIEVVKAVVDLGVNKIKITGGEPLVRKGIVELVSMISKVDGVKDFSMTTNGILLPQYANKLKEAGLQRVNISLDTTDPVKFRELTRGGDIQEVFLGIKAAQDAGLNPVKLNCVVWYSSREPDAQSVIKYAVEQGLKVRFIKEMDLETGKFSVVEGGEGGNCEICNRLRLTANGLVKPCLFNAIGFNVRELGAREAILKAVENKPACGTVNHTGGFYNIGG